MKRGGRLVVAALLAAPLWPASAQRAVRPLTDPVLRPGDQLRITVWRHPDLSGEFMVGTDSTLVHPVYQVVKVAGVPLPVVKERLRGMLVTYEQRSEEHTSELQSLAYLVCRLLLEKK